MMSRTNQDQRKLEVPEPKDKGSIAYIIILLEGAGNLFPWNVFITAAAYFGARFCGSAFEDNFENFFSISYTLAQTIGLALSIVYSDKVSTDTKIIWPLICYTGMFALTTALVAINVGANSLFWLTLFSTCLCGIFGAFLTAGLFGLCASLPAAYTGALMSGQGIAGLVVSLSGILTTISSKPQDLCADDGAFDDGAADCKFEVDYSALSYFLIATIILVACLLAYYALKKLEFIKYHLSKVHIVNASYSDPDVSSNPMVEATNNNNKSPLLKDTNFGAEKERLLNDNDQRERVNSNTYSVNEMEAGEALSLKRIYSVFSEIRTPALAVWGVFAVTIGIFPSLTVLIESPEKCKSNSRFSNDLFVPFSFLMFNLFDLLGRLMAGKYQICNAKNIWIASILRLAFFPLFLLCNVAGSQLPLLFKSDAFPIIFMMLMAFSNGYVASMSMMFGPDLVANPKNKALAGSIMAFCLTFGLLTGASLSFVTVTISQGSV
jgi:solute carrier family 29 (equilibrative nucleoside transporter), member 1/2/3